VDYLIFSFFDLMGMLLVMLCVVIWYCIECLWLVFLSLYDDFDVFVIVLLLCSYVYFSVGFGNLV